MYPACCLRPHSAALLIACSDDKSGYIEQEYFIEGTLGAVHRLQAAFALPQPRGLRDQVEASAKDTREKGFVLPEEETTIVAAATSAAIPPP
jgi:hypothetical protein